MTRPRTALAVDTFLGYTNTWIYRQMMGESSCAELVLCHARSCERAFPFKRVCISPIHQPRLESKIRGKLQPFFKYFPSKLPARNVRDYAAALKACDIQLVHAHFGTVGVKYMALCSKLGLPLIVTHHGFDITAVPKRWPAYARQLQQLWRQSPFVIAISHDMKRRLEQAGCPAERIRVSYLGVPTEDFPFVDRQHRAGPVRFLHAGRLTEKKGAPDLVRAFAEAFPDPGVAELIVVGDGEEMQLVEDAISQQAPPNPVYLKGRAAPSEMRDYFSQADVFVLNSRVDSYGTAEGLPIALLEAASTGLPCISTRHAGIPEAVIDGKTGLLVDECDTGALANAMKTVSDRETRLRMGQAARAFMEEQFTIEKCNARLGELYREAAEIHREKLKY